MKLHIDKLSRHRRSLDLRLERGATSQIRTEIATARATIFSPVFPLRGTCSVQNSILRPERRNQLYFVSLDTTVGRDR